MGHHLFGHARRRRRRGHRRYEEPRHTHDSLRYDDARHDGDHGRYDSNGRHENHADTRGFRIPGAVLIGGLVLWSLLAFGAWALVDPLLAWITGVAGPLSDLAVAIARLFGLGSEASALRDAANVPQLASWATVPLGFFVKAVLILAWIAGAVALIAAPVVMRRRLPR